VVYPCVNDLILDATCMTSNTSKLGYSSIFLRNIKPKEMKKIFTLFILLLSGTIAYGIDGEGTISNPYYGTISTTREWDPDDYTNGEIYVGTSTDNDLTIGTGGHLTILGGATIIFTQTTSDLIITGTGRITADADPGNVITFTRASGNDNWGHISFQSMGSAGSSIFDFCIIEYGDVKNLSGASGYGGGIHTDFSDLTVSNCLFRYNTAEWGGAIFVNKDESPSISNCLFLENESDNGGGGIYCWYNTASTIENCIFDSNMAGYGTSTTFYTGAGVALQSSVGTQSDQVINCTFVDNDSNHAGDGIQFYGGGTKKAVNCIFWGSNSQIVGGTGSNLINCAIQEYSTGTNTINLNSSNSASDGPNFVATDGSDWSIIFISPCRDSGTGTGAPTTDINGDNRIGSVDIGAYEVQYSRWDGSEGTSWSTDENWEQDINPGTSESDVIIPSGLSNYPTSAGTNFTISSDYQLILEPGAQLTLGTLTNSGTLRLESDASGIFSMMVDTYTDSGTEEIELYLTGGSVGASYKWHYISSPVANLSTDIFTGTTLNLVGYFEERPQASDMEGWVAFDGYVYDDGSDDDTYSFSTLNVGEGYNLYHSAASHTFSFPGTINTGNISIPLSYTTDYEGTWNGLNLVGNPYSCSIDWDVIDEGLEEGVSHAIYFTRASDGIIVSWVNGVGTYEDVTSVIPPMQGFFIKTHASSTSIDLVALSDRLHGTQPRYKSGSLIPLIRMEFTDEEQTDKAVIRFDDQASNDFDDNFDAAKFLISENRNLLWTVLNDKKYSINSIPFPDEEITIPLVINSPRQGTYNIKAYEIKGIENYDLTLTDSYENNFTVNLKEIPEYTFTSEKGKFEDRFMLTIGEVATGIDDTEDGNSFNVYIFANQLNIQNMSEQWNNALVDINIYDLTGRLISKHKDNEIYKGETIQLPFNRPTGIYLIEITDGTRRMVKKLSHR